MDEQILDGGNMSGVVARVGDTVRREALPYSSTVHRLLGHLHAAGVDWVPQPLGFDDHGRDVVSFIEGEVDHALPGLARPDHVLRDVAAKLRQWHDATVDFPHSDDDVWFWHGREPREVITHGDFAPYNHVFRDGALVGVIDAYTAYPGPRLWDIAWMVYRYVPLFPRPDEAVLHTTEGDVTHMAPALRRERLRMMLEAYGALDHDGSHRTYTVAEALEVVPHRVRAVAEWAREQDSTDHQRWATMYFAQADWIERGGVTAD